MTRPDRLQNNNTKPSLTLPDASLEELAMDKAIKLMRQANFEEDYAEAMRLHHKSNECYLTALKDQVPGSTIHDFMIFY